MDWEPCVWRQEGVVVGVRRHDVGQESIDAVNRYALRPLEREEFAVFALDLCHNQIDRHFSRFPDEELEVVNGLVPGRPLLERHDLRGSLPRGTFFRSRLHREGDRVAVRPEVYVLRTAENESFIRNIEGGVYRETSIGFSFTWPECSECSKDLRGCGHVPGRAYGDRVCHYLMRGVTEVLEGSVVSAGSQGTGFVAQERRRALAAAGALGWSPAQAEDAEPGAARSCARPWADE